MENQEKRPRPEKLVKIRVNFKESNIPENVNISFLADALVSLVPKDIIEELEGVPVFQYEEYLKKRITLE